MKKILLIGIGAGDPEQITIQAVNAMNQTNVFFVLDKGYENDDLLRLRKDICERYITHANYRIVQVQDPVRLGNPVSYEMGIEAWHEQRAVLFEQLIADEVGEGEVGGFLVWGDPSLYDSTLRILDRVLARGAQPFEYHVIPGITSVQALVARHRIPLNRIGEPIQITTGRRLMQQGADGVENVVVMLDAHCAFDRLTDSDLHIYWGAYLGTPDEILISGRLKDVSADIKRTRETARREKGWIMDTYLLRKPFKT
ncbi:MULTISPECIES: precorrin-6A synthase (deacetylating) [unclassified Pseudomonas]|uniref:precorrin-6A synthase (deacetylating) n=1 Tax=unclassified Pseudomonas TaxID=196821 RepID=UPI002AC9503A|nr:MULTISPECIES: precorrin-6A synthase (deacetylating) [unclassified Pseudomonas]MEB0041374.1 precorrin-6A synthase (deacetylating) [Pseudomonas sp. MH10]MEB0121337.1 precorrin-6A synthase (deacetylating) [Pseudomonas sp. CCI1.2]WPX64756.1 precorrin-6A synthase (deacetylating) [Pseudomonas sp. MH10]